MADIRETKISVGTIITIGSVVAGAVYVSSLYSLARKAQFQTSARVHKVDLRGITVVVSSKVINPTNGTLAIEFPYVSLFANKKMQEARMPFGNSKVSNQTFTIVPKGETQLPNIDIFIPTASLLSVAKELADGNAEFIVNLKTKVIAKYFISKNIDKDILLKFDINQIKSLFSQSQQQEVEPFSIFNLN